ncbi:MAG: CoB--CoM heterodisulfide reductase iron-sulfur subunit A family protein [Candidatus Brockarchaeota archaeon]|nr:CoB--CoM heterodisulfide reductase iron-sulfur subunit A family protein [Candidatus Brockarchaeota archaeon]
MKRLGVLLCSCSSAIGRTVDLEELAERLKVSPYVRMVGVEEELCRAQGLSNLTKFVGDGSFDGLVIGACSSRSCEGSFKAAAESRLLPPSLVEVVDLRELCSSVHFDKEGATEKAFRMIKGGLMKVANSSPLPSPKTKVVRKALVVGGGIAGVQCSLDIANAGYEVFLVEKEPSIGGVMSQLDKTIPTLDCSICIEGPKLSDAGRNKNIKLIPNAEVTRVAGQAGNFDVTVEVKPTFVDPSKCNGCGACVDVCPVYQPNRYDVDLKPIKAIYAPFAQAVPLKYVISKEICTECGMCQKACGLSAINFNDSPKTVMLNVGAIVIATGASLFDPKLKPQYHYGEFENVITSIEFERVICASGPSGGELVLRNRERPKRIAFIQCVGSRDSSVGLEDCSLFCCAVSLKQARLVKEHDPEAEVYVFYTDIRAQGKGWEDLYARVREDGVRFIRCRPSELRRDGESGEIVVPYEDSLTGGRGELKVDLAVLALGMRPSESTAKLAKAMGLQTRGPGWIEEVQPKFRPLETFVEGIFVAGTCHGPRDISESVIEGSGAAGLVLSMFNASEIVLSPFKASVDEAACTGCMRCYDACEYGAITRGEGKAVVNESACKGCGACVPACFQGAISIKGWQQESMARQVEGILEAP